MERVCLQGSIVTFIGAQHLLQLDHAHLRGARLYAIWSTKPSRIILTTTTTTTAALLPLRLPLPLRRCHCQCPCHCHCYCYFYCYCCCCYCCCTKPRHGKATQVTDNLLCLCVSETLYNARTGRCKCVCHKEVYIYIYTYIYIYIYIYISCKFFRNIVAEAVCHVKREEMLYVDDFSAVRQYAVCTVIASHLCNPLSAPSLSLSLLCMLSFGELMPERLSRSS